MVKGYPYFRKRPTRDVDLQRLAQDWTSTLATSRGARLIRRFSALKHWHRRFPDGLSKTERWTGNHRIESTCETEPAFCSNLLSRIFWRNFALADLGIADCWKQLPLKWWLVASWSCKCIMILAPLVTGNQDATRSKFLTIRRDPPKKGGRKCWQISDRILDGFLAH